MGRPRVTISGRKLATVIAVWLNHVPRWVWGQEPIYARLKAERRESGPAPDGRMIAAEHIAVELERLGWEISYSEPGGHLDLASKATDMESM
jgi:hypothetical protein